MSSALWRYNLLRYVVVLCSYFVVILYSCYLKRSLLASRLLISSSDMLASMSLLAGKSLLASKLLSIIGVLSGVAAGSSCLGMSTILHGKDTQIVEPLPNS